MQRPKLQTVTAPYLVLLKPQIRDSSNFLLFDAWSDQSRVIDQDESFQRTGEDLRELWWNNHAALKEQR